jgi:hypothetical protein
MDINHLIEHLRTQWSSPQDATFRGELIPFKLRCTFNVLGANNADVERFDTSLPNDLVHFWSTTESARLFEDASFGQWGLEILAPLVARQVTNEQERARPTDFVGGDLVIGKFIGDSELLLIRCNPEASDYGSLLVVSPLDPRPDWPTVADSLGHFLEQYALAQGDKYWEFRSLAEASGKSG